MAKRRSVASLPMYDWPETQSANDAFWTAIAGRLHAKGIAAPDALDRKAASDAVWNDADLVFSQTCGWPLITRLADKVRLVATPIYDAAGCRGASYSSFIVIRREEPASRIKEFRGRRIAFNSRDSFSGYVAPLQHISDEGLTADDFDWVEAGSHRASLRAVAAGAADLAGIDAVAWALAERHETAATSKLRVLAQTPFRPGLPFITARRQSARELQLIRSALEEVLAAPELRAARKALLLSGIEYLPEADYSALRDAA